MASAHVAAAPHGGRRKVKGALYMRLSKSKEGDKKDPSLSMPKSEGSAQEKFLISQKFFEFAKEPLLAIVDCIVIHANLSSVFTFRLLSDV